MKKQFFILILFVFAVGIVWADTPYDWYEKGRNAFETNNYDEALKCYKQAIALDPNFALAHYSLGETYHKKGMCDSAIVEYKKTLAIEPDTEMAYYNLGIIYAEKGMQDEAIIEYNKAISINPFHIRAHYNLGISCLKTGSYVLAAKYFYKTWLLYLKRR